MPSGLRRCHSLPCVVCQSFAVLCGQNEATGSSPLAAPPARHARGRTPADPQEPGIMGPVHLLLGIASVLTLVGALLGAAAMSDMPDGNRGLPWRARFVAENRRHPRLRGTAMACLAAALAVSTVWVLAR